jgi:hypothetical protein
MLGRHTPGDHRIGGIESLMRQARQIAAQPRAPAQLQSPDFGIGKKPVGGELAARSMELAQAAEIPHPGAGHGPRPLTVAGEQRHPDLSEGQERGLGKDANQVEPGVALQDRPQLMAPLQGLKRDGMSGHLVAGRLEWHGAAGYRFAVTDPRIGRHHHT